MVAGIYRSLFFRFASLRFYSFLLPLTCVIIESGALQYSIKWTVDDYLANGTPREKIILGLPLYGFRWPTNGASAGAKATGQASAVLYKTAPGLCAADPGSDNFDSITTTPWCVLNGRGIDLLTCHCCKSRGRPTMLTLKQAAVAVQAGPNSCGTTTQLLWAIRSSMPWIRICRALASGR